MNTNNALPNFAANTLSPSKGEQQSSALVSANFSELPQEGDASQWEEAVSGVNLIEQPEVLETTDTFFLKDGIVGVTPIDEPIMSNLLRSQAQMTHDQSAAVTRDRMMIDREHSASSAAAEGPNSALVSLQEESLIPFSDPLYDEQPVSSLMESNLLSGKNQEKGSRRNDTSLMASALLSTAESQQLHGTAPSRTRTSTAGVLTSASHEVGSNADQALIGQLHGSELAKHVQNAGITASTVKQENLSMQAKALVEMGKHPVSFDFATRALNVKAQTSASYQDPHTPSSVASQIDESTLGSQFSPQHLSGKSASHWFTAKLDTSYQQWGQDLVLLLRDKVNLQLGQNVNRAEIRLDPPQLGAIDMTIEVDGEFTRVQLSAANPQIRDAMLQNLEQLRQQLSQSNQGGGLEVDVRDSHDQREQQNQRNKEQSIINNITEEKADERAPQFVGSWLNRTL